MNITAQPVTDKERIVSMDIVRGIALIGIVFVNAPDYYLSLIWSYIRQDIKFPSHSFDPYLRLFYDLFIQHKFYCIFSFLFGLGFYIFMSRAQVRKARVYFLFSRRIFAMLLIGVLHFICWTGSILPFYAILGFPLMLFYKRKPRTILVWSLAFFSLTIIADGILILQQSLGFPVLEPLKWLNELLTSLFAVFGMFLLGLYAGKQNMIIQVQSHMKLLHRIREISMFMSIIPFLAITGLFFSGIEDSVVMEFFNRIGGYSITFLYLSSLFLLLQNKSLSNALKPIANMGKIGLTVYVCQNFLGSLLISLFGWSAGYTLVQSLFMAVLIIIIELIGANLYVMKFKQGPLELIWRKMTYGFKG